VLWQLNEAQDLEKVSRFYWKRFTPKALKSAQILKSVQSGHPALEYYKTLMLANCLSYLW